MSDTKQAYVPLDVRLGLTKANDVAFPLRWGIIGAGEISRQWALASHHCKGATITAVAARNIERAEAFAKKHGIERAHGSYQELLQSDDIDVVYIGTIDSLHKQHCIQAIEAGKHVLCEKALAWNPADAREMFDAANKKNVMLQDGMWTRFMPAVEHARYLMETGKIGEIMTVQADFDTYYTTQAVSLAFGTEQQPKNLLVAGWHMGAGGAILEFSQERFAHLTFISYPSEFPEVTEFIGTKGRITLEQPAHCPTRMTLRAPKYAPSRYEDKNKPAPKIHFDFALPEWVTIPDSFPNQEGFIYQTEAVHRCLAAGLTECPQIDQHQSIYNLELLHSIRTRLKGYDRPIPKTKAEWLEEKRRRESPNQN